MKINPGIILSGTVFSTTLVSCHNGRTGNGDRPNIILIITDDQGYGDIGIHGNPYIQTPVLDSLARHSTWLSQFYVCPVSAPTRACLMTGRYAYRTGVYDTYNGGAIMATEETTLAELLKKSGYHTGIIGKWHLGDNYPFRPQDQGFDETFVHGGGGIGQQGDAEENFINKDSSYFNPVIRHNGKPVKTRGYCTDVFTDEAIRYIRNNHTRPFFLYLAYNAPHTPLQVPGHYLHRYDSLKIDTSFNVKGGAPLQMTDKDQEDAKRVYAMVSCIDDNIGRIWQTLRDLEIEENTIVIFMTDNGPQQNRFKGGLKGKKSNVLEGGIRVPFYMYWKNHIPAQTIESPAAAIDILPTLCDMLSVPLPAKLKIDGISLKSNLTGRPGTNIERPLFFLWSRGYCEPYYHIAVRQGEWKMVGETPYTKSDTALQLYHLKDDPYEMKNLALQYPDKLKALRTTFDHWYSDVIKTPSLLNASCILGTPYENPVVLTRQDWHGARGKYWDRPDGYGWWNVTVSNKGLYSFDVHYKDNLPSPGKALIRIGTTQRSVLNTGTTTRIIHFPAFELPEGQFIAEAWYEAKGEIIAPMYIYITYTE